MSGGWPAAPGQACYAPGKRIPRGKSMKTLIPFILLICGLGLAAFVWYGNKRASEKSDEERVLEAVLEQQEQARAAQARAESLMSDILAAPAACGSFSSSSHSALQVSASRPKISRSDSSLTLDPNPDPNPSHNPNPNRRSRGRTRRGRAGPPAARCLSRARARARSSMPKGFRARARSSCLRARG